MDISANSPVAVLGFNLRILHSLAKFKKRYVAVVPPEFSPFMLKHSLPHVVWDFYHTPLEQGYLLGMSLASLGCHWSVPLYEETVEWAGVVNAYLTSNPHLAEHYRLFRDKPSMKRRAQLNGLKVGVFEEVQSREGLIELFEKVNLANLTVESSEKTWLHLKPVNLAGSEGHICIKKRVEIDSLSENHFPCLAESHLNGRECSVEALIFQGKIYFVNITEYVELGIFRFLPASAYFKYHEKALLEALEALVKGFSIRHGGIHAEFFVDEGGSIGFGEVAYRIPGGQIFDLIVKSYGFDVYYAYILASDPRTKIEDLESVLPDSSSKRKRYACLSLYPPKGKVMGTIAPEEMLLHPTYEGHRLEEPQSESVGKRTGFGNPLGSVFFGSKKHEKLLETYYALGGLNYFKSNSNEVSGYKNTQAIADFLGLRSKVLLQHLAKTQTFAKALFQDDFFSISKVLIQFDEGLEALFDLAADFDSVGLFSGGDWEYPLQLRPELVGQNLSSSEISVTLECLSNLRMLSIALERCKHPHVSASYSESYLHNVLLTWSNFLTEVNTGGDVGKRLLRFLVQKIDPRQGLEALVRYKAKLLARRPISPDCFAGIAWIEKTLLSRSLDPDRDSDSLLSKGLNAILTNDHASSFDLIGYRESIPEKSEKALLDDMNEFKGVLSEFHYASPLHGVLLRSIAKQVPKSSDSTQKLYLKKIEDGLGLTDIGRQEFAQHQEFALACCRRLFVPSLCQSIFALRNCLNGQVFSKYDLQASLKSLWEVDVHQSIRSLVLKGKHQKAGLSAIDVIVSYTLLLIAHPLGVFRPMGMSSQMTRAISFWAQTNPRKLIQFIVQTTSNKRLTMTFQGKLLTGSPNSKPRTPAGRMDDTSFNSSLDFCDPVTRLLHKDLQSLYSQMLAECPIPSEDSHELINPAFYGDEVPRGFMSISDLVTTNQIRNYRRSIEVFYSYFYECSDQQGNRPIPCGLMACNELGEWIGPLGVLLQRVNTDWLGCRRVYFFNPDIHAGLKWGPGLEISVSGNGENLGECSLPFEQFASFLYAFHYDPEWNPLPVTSIPYEQIKYYALATWGRNFFWTEL